MSEPSTSTTPSGPVIDLARLTAADMRTVLAIQEASGTARASLLLDLLERATDGGLSAIPLPKLPAYLSRLDKELDEVLSPKA